ncbi:MAG: glycoside hydrolase family 2 TIM barrel-domain containing protein [Acidobacteriota bacterium]|nr:glycoside hydrolase family 2 TIM barrel-domain containing protein [Acidobacteriota bacterium]
MHRRILIARGLVVLFLISASGAAFAQTAPAAVPRPEYPRPDFVRADWLNLNGPWAFALDLSDTGEERGMAAGSGFDRTIRVPFAPESPLSGVGYLDFMSAVWYRRSFAVPEAWRGRRILLNFEAVDYQTTVWINGRKAGGHEGGFTPFAVDITDLLAPKDNVLVLRARDDTRSGRQPVGKQSRLFASHDCAYRRTTGIWQTVWLEPAPAVRIERYKASCDIENAEANLHVYFNVPPGAGTVTAKISFLGKPVAAQTKKADQVVRFVFTLKNAKLWDLRAPNLYDVEFVYEKDKAVADRATGYFGMRKFEARDGKFYLNNRPLFLRTVLDQGFYPDGIMTAPDDAALKKDIELSMSLGFDGARLHQKVFERRFLHWADRLGYLVWGEFPDWGLDLGRAESFLTFSREWTEAVERDLNHPAIIGWCPFNERWGSHTPGLIPAVFKLTKLLDPSRPVIDASGGWHYISPDVYDAHDYDQNPATFKARFGGLLAKPPLIYVNDGPEHNVPYAGQPYFLSEYGGIWWHPGQADEKAWGYGERPKTIQEYLDRFKRLTDVLLDNPAVAGLCYTQLTDVEQEVNGLLSFDRTPKHDPAYFFKVMQRRAAAEK